jgi:hypothetical protein
LKKPFPLTKECGTEAELLGRGGKPIASIIGSSLGQIVDLEIGNGRLLVEGHQRLMEVVSASAMPVQV